MKYAFAVLAALIIAALSTPCLAAIYDAAEEYVCDSSTSEIWSYEGYRAEDGSYLDMAFGRAELPEVTKYGIDAHFIPDGDQPYYPFILRFPDGLWASPATAGRRFDAVLRWKAPEAANARFSGTVTLKGTMGGGPVGKKIKAMLVRGGDELWSSEVEGGKPVDFDVETPVNPGDKVRLHLVNAGDSSGDLAVFDMKVETSPR